MEEMMIRWTTKSLLWKTTMFQFGKSYRTKWAMASSSLCWITRGYIPWSENVHPRK
jgi:hypothetical protein